MTQATLNFESEQQRQIRRVGGRIGEIVLDFCRTYKPHGEFHATLLHEYVKQRAGTHIAPDSPNRILRLLAQQGDVSYEVVSRSQSLYKILAVKGQ